MRVTETLHRNGPIIDTAHFTEYHRERGTGVHRACQLWDEGDLDEGSLTPDIAPRFAQYVAFRHELRPEIIATELEVRHPVLGYEGRLDRVMKINGRLGVVDIKGPTENPWHALQLAAYSQAYGSMRGVLRGLARWNLYLHDDRSRLVERTDRHDFEVFYAAHTVAQWREKNGY